VKTRKSALALLADVFRIRAQIEREVGEVADFQGVERKALLQAVDIDALMGHLLKELDGFFTDEELARLLKAFSGAVGKSLVVKLPSFSEKIDHIVNAYIDEKFTMYFKILDAGSGDEEGGDDDGSNGSPLAN
jgi:hypothetical protein